jgi:enoyl-CoA hydratase/carnithine racemase
MASPVVFDLVPTQQGRTLGVVTLNTPVTLNSLTLEMIDLMTPQLIAWRDDDEVVMVLFQSVSDKAFCAGGDIQALYQSMQDHPGGPNPYAESFFEREYQLDYIIYTYPKPTLVWGHGIVMGGGLGILGGCSHRIGTPTTRIALPEITIGLFPDAGATWLLGRMPHHWAYFIAWTGCQLNAQDGKYVGLIDYLIPIEEQPAVLEQLTIANWRSDSNANKQQLDEMLGAFETSLGSFPVSALISHEAEITSLMADALAAENSAAAFALAMSRYSAEKPDDKFMLRAAGGINNGSPTTAHIIYEQIQRAPDLSLAQAFQLELVIAVQCSRHPDFTEGVRALLIDKDNRPAWRYEDLQAVPSAWVDEHFTAPWPVNPLIDLDM